MILRQGIPTSVLKKEYVRARGKRVTKNNIEAAKLIANLIKSSLGPKGAYKMFIDPAGNVTVTNDGATMLREMYIENPAAMLMVEIAKAQDVEVGDGTKSVVILAGKLLEEASELIEKGIHPTIIIQGYEAAREEALKLFRDMAVEIKRDHIKQLKKVALTSMASKLAGDEDFLSQIIVDAVFSIEEKINHKVKIDLDNVKIEKKQGQNIGDTKLISGVVIEGRASSHMNKRVEDAKIVLINTSIELKKTKVDARIGIDDPEQIKAFLKEEREILRDIVNRISLMGANVLFCRKGIAEVAKFYLAKAKILAVERVKISDMEKLMRATGGKMIINLDDLTDKDLGEASLVEERRIGDDNWIFVEGCKNPKSVTILIRGGNKEIIEEAERSIHDALSVVRDVLMKPFIVAGGGASEAEVALRIREWALSLSGREQLAALKFAEALKTIPLTLAENAGLDTIEIEAELRSKHEKGEKWAGVGVYERDVSDMMKKGIVEPLSVKEQMVKSATSVASVILRVDDVIASSKRESVRVRRAEK